MENIESFDMSGPTLGELDFDEMINTYLIYDGSEVDWGHGHTADEEEGTLRGDLINTSFKKRKRSCETPHLSAIGVDNNYTAVAKLDRGLTPSINCTVIGSSCSTTSDSVNDESMTTLNVKLLLSKVEENDKMVRSLLNELGELRKKVVDQDAVINKLSDLVCNLQCEIKKSTLETSLQPPQTEMLHEKKMLDVKDTTNKTVGSIEMDCSNDVGNAGCIFENGMNEIVQDESLMKTDYENKDNIDSLVMEHGDLLLFPGNVALSESMTTENTHKQINTSCGEKASVFYGCSFTSGKFECQMCHEVFPTKTKLKTHLWDHSKKKPFVCCICKHPTGQRGNLAEHISRLHKFSLDTNENVFVKKAGPEGFRCCFCLEVMESKEFYKTHINTVHIDLLRKNVMDMPSDNY